MEITGRRCREMSPDRARPCNQPKAMRPTFKKVQVVYYLSRNGHLEHPHYMEVSHLAHQPLRLKDVMDRLTSLRGKGMPSLYSWSCKRSYKNGYVWNDLGENDIVYPSEGAEYVLKGSELIEGCTEKLQHIQVSNVQQFQLGNNQQGVQVQDHDFQARRRSLASKQHHHPEQVLNNQYHENTEEPEEEFIEEYEEKTSYTTSTTPHSRCSRGVSTDELDEKEITQKNNNVTTNLDSNSLSSTSSNLSDKANEQNKNVSKRFEDGDPIGNEPLLSRNSMLFSLISACGGSASFRKSVPPSIVKSPPPSVAGRKSGSLYKGVVCKAANGVVAEEEMIFCMSENPRFGNLQSEEKEYFSGSIVEAINTEERVLVEPRLKKSSSYNEERSTKAGLGEVAEEEIKRENSAKGKCIPTRKKLSSKQTKK